MPALTDAHIATLAAIRNATRTGVANAWQALAAYDEAQVQQFLAQAVPIVTAGQQHAARVTDAYIAAMLGRQPLGIPTAAVTGAAIRAGATPAEVYRRPFITVWTALAAGTPYIQAVHDGLARATNLAATDVQLTSRATFEQLQQRDPAILGYRRQADPGACKFCQLVDGAFVKSANAMPLHPGCGCGLEPITSHFDATPTPAGVAIHDHGELGPTLSDPAHDFTTPSELQH